MRLRSILFSTVIFISIASSVLAQTQGQEFLIHYNRGMLSLSVENADLQRVLTGVAENAGISFTWPKNLEKLVTIRFYDVPLEQGLRRILKGLSYALIYAPSGEKDGVETVSGVYVCPEGPRGRGRSRRTFREYVRSKTEEERKAAALERYERKLDFLEQRMAVVDKDSPQGKSIRRQILLLERNIEKLLRE